MANHNELRDMRAEVIHFKSKYKFTVLKSSMMPQTFVGSQRKYKIYITIYIRVLFCCLIYRHNIFKKLETFTVLILLISNLKSVFLLLSLLVSVHPDPKIFFGIMSETTVHTKMCY